MGAGELAPLPWPENAGRYARLKAPVIFRFAPLFPNATLDPEPADTAIRVYSDEAVEKGWRLTLEILLSDRAVHCHGQVAWVGRLPNDGQAKYDVGIRLLDLGKEQRRALESYLE